MNFNTNVSTVSPSADPATIPPQPRQKTPLQDQMQQLLQQRKMEKEEQKAHMDLRKAHLKCIDQREKMEISNKYKKLCAQIKKDPMPVSYHMQANLPIPEYDCNVQKKLSGLQCQRVFPNPQQAYSHYEESAKYAKGGQYTKAIECLKEAVKYDSKNAFYHYKLGNYFERNNEIDQGLDCVNKAIEYDSMNAYYRHKRGSYYYKNKDYTAAITDFSEAIIKEEMKYKPKPAHYYYARGEAYQKVGENKKALSDFNTAIKLDPKNVNWLQKHGFQQQAYFLDTISHDTQNPLFNLVAAIEMEADNQ